MFGKNMWGSFMWGGLEVDPPVLYDTYIKGDIFSGRLDGDVFSGRLDGDAFGDRQDARIYEKGRRE